MQSLADRRFRLLLRDATARIVSTVRSPRPAGPVAAGGALTPVRRWLTAPLLALAAGGAAAAGLIFVSLGQRPLWFDETVSAEAARLPLGRLGAYLVDTEVNMGLYTLLLHGWLGLGSGESFVRSLSAVFALVTLPVLYLLARRLFDRRTACVSVVLCSVNVAFVGHAREARGYSLALLLVTASSLYLVAAVQDGRRRDWALYSLTAALAVFAHLFAGLVVLAQLASLLAVRGGLDRRRALASAAAVCLLFAPVAAVAAVNGQGSRIDWLEQPRLRQLPGLLEWFTDSRALTALFLLGAAAALRAAYADGRAGGLAATWRYGFLLLWLVLPPLLAYGASFEKPVYLYRYFLPSLPALVILVSAGLARLPRLWLLLPALLLAAALSTRTVVSCLPDCKVRHDDWRGAAAYVDDRVRTGDAVLFDPGELRTAIAHYASRRPRLLYPERWPLAGGRREGATTFAGALARADTHRRVWLVTWWLPQGEVPARLGRRFRVAADRSFAGNVRVRLYVRRPRPA